MALGTNLILVDRKHTLSTATLHLRLVQWSQLNSCLPVHSLLVDIRTVHDEALIML